MKKKDPKVLSHRKATIEAMEAVIIRNHDSLVNAINTEVSRALEALNE